jgi:REP element-mobilizing transposase RayT
MQGVARKPRRDFPGAIHHVFGRGNHKKFIFETETAKARFVHRLLILQPEMGFSLYAYCLLSNHYHLLIQTGDVPLSETMHRLLGWYAGRLNKVTGTVGHVFQGRYGESLCETDAYFKWLIRYIHLNPVEAGLADDPAGWAWSSHRDFLAGTSAVVELEKPLGILAGVCGYQDFLNSEDTPLRTIERIAADAAAAAGMDRDELFQRKKRFANGRHLFMSHAIAEGFSQTEIAAYLGCSQAAVSLALSRKL